MINKMYKKNPLSKFVTINLPNMVPKFRIIFQNLINKNIKGLSGYRDKRVRK